MKSYIYTAVLLLLFMSLNAQQITFEKSFKLLQNEEAAISCIEDNDGGFVIGIGPKYSTPLFLRDYGLIKLNEYGDTVWHTTFFLNYSTTLRLVKKTPDNGYITIGLAEDSVSGNQQSMLWIAKFDSIGNLIWTRFYSNSQYYFIPELLSAEFVTGNNLFVCSGYSQFIILDSLYNLVNFNYIPYFYHGGNSGSKEKSISYQGNFWYYTFYSTVQLGPYIIKLLAVNQNGDTVRSIPVPNDTLAGGGIIKITNSYFLIGGYKKIGAIATFFVSKIDSVGNKLWSKRLSLPYGNGVNFKQNGYCTLNNGNNLLSFKPNLNLDTRSFIYCFNDNGDSLWTQFYKDDSLYETTLLDIIATSDSGLLACGQIKEPGGVLKDYLVKTNSNGVILNASNEIAKQNTHYLHLYPNPANTFSNLHYIGEKNATLSITNLQGQEIYIQQLTLNDEQVKINTTLFDSGFYVCSIRANGRVVANKKLVVLK